MEQVWSGKKKQTVVFVKFLYVCYLLKQSVLLGLKQLGLGDVIDRNAPSEVRIKDCVPKNIACGWWHTLLLGQSSL